MEHRSFATASRLPPPASRLPPPASRLPHLMPRRRSLTPLHHAFDEARFGAERTLNLRASLPSPYHAVKRAEAWLRERQVARAGEVLVITGRGNQSFDNVSVVREAIVKLLASLRRRGVVDREIGR